MYLDWNSAGLNFTWIQMQLDSKSFELKLTWIHLDSTLIVFNVNVIESGIVFEVNLIESGIEIRIKAAAARTMLVPTHPHKICVRYDPIH